jgi:hypothetical protein
MLGPLPRPNLAQMAPYLVSLYVSSLAFYGRMDGPKWSLDASWVPILPGPASAARDGFGLGFGPPLCGFIVGCFDLCLRPRLFGKWASFSSYGFLIFLGPFMCTSIYALL